jgi:hypothetical protein
MRAIMASKVDGPSRNSRTRLPQETSAAAMRQSAREKEGRGPSSGPLRSMTVGRPRGWLVTL